MASEFTRSSYYSFIIKLLRAQRCFFFLAIRATFSDKLLRRSKCVLSRIMDTLISQRRAQNFRKNIWSSSGSKSRTWRRRTKSLVLFLFRQDLMHSQVLLVGNKLAHFVASSQVGYTRYTSNTVIRVLIT